MSQSTLRPRPLKDAGAYRLTTSFPYIVRRLGLRIGELFDRAVAPFGIDVSMWRVMAALYETDGQQLGQLSDVTTIELSTLSRLIGAMTAKGLVTRRRPRDNGRIVEISLSAKGRRLAEDLTPVATRFEEIAVGSLSDAEVARLKSQLEGAYRNLDTLEQEVGAVGPGAVRPVRKRRPSVAKVRA